MALYATGRVVTVISRRGREAARPSASAGLRGQLQGRRRRTGRFGPNHESLRHLQPEQWPQDENVAKGPGFRGPPVLSRTPLELDMVPAAFKFNLVDACDASTAKMAATSSTST